MLRDDDFYIEYNAQTRSYSAILFDGTEIVLLSKTKNDAVREVTNLVKDNERVYDEY